MSGPHPQCHQVKLTADELLRLTSKYNCVLQLQRSLQQLGEVAFKASIQRPGELRDMTIGLLTVDTSATVNKGQSLSTNISAFVVRC